jgi:UDP:flavonoid glycosyltransferase YjiC (YdhE family)
LKVIILAGVAPSTIFTHVPLATALRNAGHQVMMTAAMDGMIKTITEVGLSAVRVTDPNLSARQIIAGAGLARVPEDAVERERLAGQWWARLDAVTLDALLAFAKDWRPDVVVGGMCAYAGPLLAAHLGVPWVRHAWDIHDPSLMDAGANDELREELAVLGLDRLPEPDMLIDVAPPSLRPQSTVPAHMMRWIPGNSPALLEPWMYTRGEGARIGVTIGTGVAEYNQYDFLQGILENVTTLDAEVVVPVAEDAAPVIRERMGKNVRAGWIPLDVLAPTCDVLVHQSGGSTMMTALSTGVPQIMIPDPGLHRAQEMARRIAEAGAGIVLTPQEATSEIVAKSCQEIISNPSYATAASAIAQEIAALPLPSEVARRIEWVVHEAAAGRR